MKLNPHPSCSCGICRRASSGRKAVIKRQTTRSIRQLSRRLIRQGSEEPPIVPGGYRD